MKKRFSLIALSSMMVMNLIACNNSSSQSTESTEPTSETPVLKEYSITWLDYNYTQLKVDTVLEGTLPEYGSIPTREGNIYCDYEFSGWTPEVVPASADATYVATYDAIPHSEITEEQYNQAIGFVGMNFSVRIEDNKGFYEELNHDVDNSYYSKFKQGDDAMQYHAMRYNHVDFYDCFMGEQNGDRVDWHADVSSDFEHLQNFAFDNNEYIQYLMKRTFDIFSYNSEKKCYVGNPQSNATMELYFAGPRLDKMHIVVDGDWEIDAIFYDYGTTKINYDQYLTELVTCLYPSPELLKQIINDKLYYYYQRSIECTVKYTYDGSTLETYEVHMDTFYFQFIYDGEYEFDDDYTEGTFLFDPQHFDSFMLDGDVFVQVDDDLCNPYSPNKTVGSTTNAAFTMVSDEALNVGYTWENYNNSECGKTSFDCNGKNFTFYLKYDLATYSAYIDDVHITFMDGDKEVVYKIQDVKLNVEDIHPQFDD